MINMPKKNHYYMSKKVSDLVKAYQAIGKEETKKLEEAGNAIKENTIRVTLFVDGDDSFFVRNDKFLKWKKPLDTLSDSDILVVSHGLPNMNSKHKLIGFGKEALCSYLEFKNNRKKYLDIACPDIRNELQDGRAYVLDNSTVKVGSGYIDFFVIKAEANNIKNLKVADFVAEAFIRNTGTLCHTFLNDIKHKKSSSLTPEEHASLMGIYADLGAILG